MARGRSAAARAVALVGPNGAGKTTLMEALLFSAGAIERQGAVLTGTTVGDASPEARARGQSVEMSIASFTHEGDRYALIDLPGSNEFAGELDHTLSAVDLAVVVCDPDPDKAILLQPTLLELDRLGVPRLLFVNKMDTARGRLRDLLEALQAVSSIPLVARQIPIWENEKATGYVDLALERAYVYRTGKPSERVDIPKNILDREHEARFTMLEKLADYDDTLMEQLLSDQTPSVDAVFDDLVHEMREVLIAPVFLGSAQADGGVNRLLKALRHETPAPDAAQKRLGVSGAGLFVFKTSHAGQAGKQSFARAFGGAVADGAELLRPDGEKLRASGVVHLTGAAQKKANTADVGEVVAVGRMESARPGDFLSAEARPQAANSARPARFGVYALAIAPQDRKDDVRLSQSMAKLAEEDPTLKFAMNPETHELVLEGQGEVHLRIALDRMKRRYGVAVTTSRPKSAYKETIRKGATVRGRHKKQSGGHGQFGDVVVEIAARPRSSGFEFTEKIHGGVVPRQYIPAVEAGVRDGLEKGPLGFPVVDLAVTLTDGSAHAVDSSEIAFRTAGRVAMSEGLPQCEPILLEPVEKITIYAPNTATSKINSMLSSRRGQILGFDARDGWPGWDRIEAYLPQADRHDLIIDLRSITQGLGTYEAAFAHMAELTGREAQEIVQKAKAAA
ncbi:MAG: elongation factor G [Hyphomonadaceae bacterium]|nr:MAG: elongation factor G [Caulobacteraceae bacterium]MBT9446283.1 elongation factor G [Hyphomonadaceae bacterium]TPW08881.1 MAG: elongation factor G [Alphaproteobacteria bacterium]